MNGMNAGDNPYRAAPGSEPPELAGRASELGAADTALAMGRAGQAAKPIVYTGLRGMGKTALLRTVERRAKALDGVVLFAEADASLSFGETLQRSFRQGHRPRGVAPKPRRSGVARVRRTAPDDLVRAPGRRGIARNLCRRGRRESRAPLGRCPRRSARVALGAALQSRSVSRARDRRDPRGCSAGAAAAHPRGASQRRWRRAHHVLRCGLAAEPEHLARGASVHRTLVLPATRPPRCGCRRTCDCGSGAHARGDVGPRRHRGGRSCQRRLSLFRSGARVGGMGCARGR